MKRKLNKIVFIILIIVMGTVLVSCNNEEVLNRNADGNNQNNETTNITEEKTDQQIIETVKKRMFEKSSMELDTVEIIDEYSSENKLVKMTRKTFYDSYGFYNTKSNEFHVIPSDLMFVDSYEIINENHIIMHLSGANSESGYHIPPYSIDCRKTVLEDGKIGFTGTQKILYHTLDESISFGGKENHKLKDIIVTLRGVQLAFGPQDNNDVGYFAAYTICPYTETSYNVNDREFIIEFHETIIDEELIENGLELEESNANVDTIKLEQKDNSVFVTLKLKEYKENYFNPKYYTAKIGETPTTPVTAEFYFYSEGLINR